MRKNAFRHLALIVCLVLAAGVGFATKSKNAQPKKAEITTAEQKTAPKIEKAAALSSASRQLSGEQINWWVISAGGVDGSSATFRMKATVGQTAVGGGSSENYRLSHGFWPDFGSPGCCELRGDLDHSGTVDIADILYFVEFSFGSPPGPAPVCDEGGYYPEADLDANMTVDIADLLYFVEYSFGSPPGPAPVPCP